ncbi:Z1 domain-containing protein [Nocardioides sp. NBC_00850]|uniref:Z1 domain-containing protein n=1 Tax=Nocardioides sp. NBC_00850 TaxID=2976001 RepID=UPI003867EA5E|nr:Z1 domain-containing protein [Nocardioides sp. NBC_00850]
MLIDRMRRRGETLDVAARSAAEGLGVPVATFQSAIDSIRADIDQNQLLDTPTGVVDRRTEDEARLAAWYSGPEDGDEFWPRLREHLSSGSMSDVIDEIDQASTKVVAQLSNPNVMRLKKRGMVVGYVQSGKTANYTAVMAKAADAGFKLFIVLAGLHNNLRRQTQVRLSKDLVDDSWAGLTTNDADFGNVINGAAMLKRGVHAVAVVKKNPTRLKKLRNWLHDIPPDIRARVPVLLLDDEADQATPNSATGRQQRTAINKLLREIWGEIPTGTYLGYTATPFANIFMDPNDETELYPSDFILDLPRPEAYFGAERVFGREPVDDDDAPDSGLDMVRDIPQLDADALSPPSSKDARSDFDPDVPKSLIDAVVWFLVATAIRRARGQVAAHSSMLVHTTHYTDPHFAMRDRIATLVSQLRDEWSRSRTVRFETSYASEANRVREVATRPLPGWDLVADSLGEVLGSVRVVVDNGSSEDRLDYEKTDEQGQPLPETVIAIGGGTLSRGLTLEGLVVSYFTRTSNTYDTLLQMGRWFGYRPGYEDLPRIWMQESLAEEFRFLALVEEEIRLDMRHMERMGVTPKEMGVRVRSHPGRLSIVARNKMQHADVVRVSFSGQRLQTFMFDPGQATAHRNIKATRTFIQRCKEVADPVRSRNSKRWHFADVPREVVTEYLGAYAFHPDQVSLGADLMTGWIEKAAPEALWNVVVIGQSRTQRRSTGEVIDLGSVDLGLDEPVPAVNRAPLVKSTPGVANIKALLSHQDWFRDLDHAVVSQLSAEARKVPQSVRREHADGRGLIIVYPVSKDSEPMARGETKAKSRRRMDAEEHMIGLGIIFPDVDRDGVASEGTYYSVHPDWEVEVAEDEDLPRDTEPGAQVDGATAGAGDN